MIISLHNHNRTVYIILISFIIWIIPRWPIKLSNNRIESLILFQLSYKRYTQIPFFNLLMNFNLLVSIMIKFDLHHIEIKISLSIPLRKLPRFDIQYTLPIMNPLTLAIHTWIDIHITTHSMLTTHYVHIDFPICHNAIWVLCH